MRTVASLYTYTGRNLLQNPEAYMYSEFKGEAFLKDYLQARNQFAEAFENRYLSCLQNRTSDSLFERRPLFFNMVWKQWNLLYSAEIASLHSSFLKGWEKDKKYHSSSPPTLPSDLLGRMNTQEVLESLLLCQVQKKENPMDICDRLLEFFLARFEITKKVYTAYDNGKRALSEQSHVLVNYALLGLNGILQYKREKILTALNASLKINDLLCSAQENVILPGELSLTIASLRMEIQAVKSLCFEKRIGL
jgi:hypothetical protein